MICECLVNGYGLNGMGTEAVELYRQMPEELIDEVTHVCVLNACSHAGLVAEARSIFKNIKNKSEFIFGSMVCQTDLFLDIFIIIIRNFI